MVWRMSYYYVAASVGCTSTRPDGLNFTSLLIGAVRNSTVDANKLSAVKCADFHKTLFLNTTEMTRTYGGQCAPNNVSMTLTIVGI
jgi:hypothetical protein